MCDFHEISFFFLTHFINVKKFKNFEIIELINQWTDFNKTFFY